MSLLLAAASSDSVSIDTVDPDVEMVALPSAKHQALVNLQTLETACEISKSLFDVMA